MGLGFTTVRRWMPVASLGTSPSIPGNLDTTKVIGREGEDYIKTGTRSLKTEEEEKTITSQGPEPFVTPNCIFQRVRGRNNKTTTTKKKQQPPPTTFQDLKH